jgi:hypothetical protein
MPDMHGVPVVERGCFRGSLAMHLTESNMFDLRGDVIDDTPHGGIPHDTLCDSNDNAEITLVVTKYYPDIDIY